MVKKGFLLTMLKLATTRVSSKLSCVLMESDLFAFRLTESYQFVPSRKIKGQHHGQKRVFVDHAQTCHYSCIIQAFMCVDGKRSICI
ncbi:hypothetical protein DAPPUDRAFT_341202 [Daphnia pulex]|uniref:Secreted protein n=1 Tax=Daphnia pulex TaxID=6669 RepID=E9I593_DAPPU|nr:hypothetical protein DAPPUDRAFT_341202 [Daphnia pulex]|eukprot:EFX60837.1 hypothetical protein DAPPUDRAFT_341202 [Daphnia pulex]